MYNVFVVHQLQRFMIEAQQLLKISFLDVYLHLLQVRFLKFKHCRTFLIT